MGTILFECPMTGRPVSTGIETEPISFAAFRKRGSTYIARSVDVSMGQKSGFRKCPF